MKAAIYARISDGRHEAALYDWQVQHAYEWPYADRNILISWMHFRWWKESGK